MRSRAIVVAAALLATACARSAPHASPSTPAQFLEWLSQHPSNVGLAAYEIGDEAHGIYHDAQGKFPLASTRKVLILGAYAAQVGERKLSPSERIATSAVERWYWAGTDGGAHDNALQDLRSRGRIDASQRITLDDVAWSAIRWSDNAAADYLLARVGGAKTVDDFASQSGMKAQDPLMPILGEFVAWSKLGVGAWRALSPRDRAIKGAELAASTTSAPVLAQPSAADEFTLAETSPRGTPRDWAHLMAQLYANPSADLRRTIEWPLAAFADNRARFDRFGTKGGSLPGVLTEATYVKPKGRKPMVVAIFLHDLKQDDWLAFTRSFVHQQFVTKIAEDPAFRDQVRMKLG